MSKVNEIKAAKYARDYNLHEITVPSNIITIDEKAFYDCKALKEVALPLSLINIGDDAFALCRELKELKLPDSLSVIGKRCFSWSGLESVTVPGNVKVIENQAFFRCGNLKEVIIEDGCTIIEAYAFAYCTALTKISVPPSVEFIGEGAFMNCPTLREIALPDGVELLPSKTFENDKALFEIKIPDSVTEIGEECFSGCVSLEKVEFSQCLKTIQMNAFRRCEKLRFADLPESLMNIGDNAFSLCTNICTVNLRGSIKTVGATAFRDNKCNAPERIENMLSSSFLYRGESKTCPEVTVPESVMTLSLGFENLLSYGEINKGKTCRCHMLVLRKYNIKVFIGEKYYSYNDRNDSVIRNGEFDFKKYDEQFVRANDNEKLLVSLYRLAYPRELPEKYRKIYGEALLNEKEKAMRFAVNSNDEVLLKYLIDSFDFSSDFYDEMYENALIAGNVKLQRTIMQKTKKTGFSELDSIIRELF